MRIVGPLFLASAIAVAMGGIAVAASTGNHNHPLPAFSTGTTTTTGEPSCDSFPNSNPNGTVRGHLCER